MLCGNETVWIMGTGVCCPKSRTHKDIHMVNCGFPSTNKSLITPRCLNQTPQILQFNDWMNWLYFLTVTLKFEISFLLLNSSSYGKPEYIVVSNFAQPGITLQYSTTDHSLINHGVLYISNHIFKLPTKTSDIWEDVITYPSVNLYPYCTLHQTVNNAFWRGGLKPIMTNWVHQSNDILSSMFPHTFRIIKFRKWN